MGIVGWPRSNIERTELLEVCASSVCKADGMPVLISEDCHTLQLWISNSRGDSGCRDEKPQRAEEQGGQNCGEHPAFQIL